MSTCAAGASAPSSRGRHVLTTGGPQSMRSSETATSAWGWQAPCPSGRSSCTEAQCGATSTHRRDAAPRVKVQQRPDMLPPAGCSRLGCTAKCTTHAAAHMPCNTALHASSRPAFKPVASSKTAAGGRTHHISSASWLLLWLSSVAPAKQRGASKGCVVLWSPRCALGCVHPNFHGLCFYRFPRASLGGGTGAGGLRGVAALCVTRCVCMRGMAG